MTDLDLFMAMISNYKIETRMDGDKCSLCGECCSNILPITEAEIRRIKKYIKAHNIKESKHIFVAPFVGEVVDNVCPFRNNENKKCTIYPVRPWICEKFYCNQSPMHLVPDARRDKDRVLGAKAIDMRETFFK